MKTTLTLAVMIIIISLAGTADAAEPLVNAEWVNANAGKSGIVFLDVRDESAYLNGHLPGAVHTNYGAPYWTVVKNGVPGMLPDAGHLAALIGGLGIGNEDHVVLAPAGFSAGEMSTATRIYWTFKTAGHDQISILDGGMAAYFKKQQHPLAKGETKPTSKTFKVTFRPEFLAVIEDVKKARNGGNLVDSRSAGQFSGVIQSPSVKRPGTIPGAKNLPIMSLTENNGGIFLGADKAAALHREAGIATTGPVITFCNTGHMASLGWFVLHELLGNREARLYDGSMAEWTQDDANPVQTEFTPK